jgi:hypothetical protein
MFNRLAKMAYLALIPASVFFVLRPMIPLAFGVAILDALT